ncbi:MAG: helix-turn-helix transcriptional regulator [Lachnospiraceae bacterium]|nr:helix-turn-helix transcriptional regulator [Lachnospiraceae bacterium]
MPDFECRLKKYRQQKDMTQEELAVMVGVRRLRRYLYSNDKETAGAVSFYAHGYPREICQQELTGARRANNGEKSPLPD